MKKRSLQSNEIIEVIQDYVNKPHTDYAIMINGEWGSGKTFFWKEIVSEKIRDKNPKSKLLYVDLYGIESAKEVKKRMYAALIPTDKIVGKAAKMILNIGWSKLAKSNEIDEDVINLFGKEDFFNIKSSDVICFDNLERVHKDILFDVLGVLNNLVEGIGIKMILIANEDEIFGLEKNEEEYDVDDNLNELSKKRSKYERIKEKLIRFTIDYKVDFATALLPITEKVSGEDKVSDKEKKYSTFIQDNKTDIISVFERYKCDNLRSLSFALDIFYELFKIINKVITKAEHENVKLEIQEKILRIVLLKALEYKHPKDIFSRRSDALTMQINGYISIGLLDKPSFKKLIGNLLIDKTERKEISDLLNSFHDSEYKELQEVVQKLTVLGKEGKLTISDYDRMFQSLALYNRDYDYPDVDLILLFANCEEDIKQQLKDLEDNKQISDWRKNPPPKPDSDPVSKSIFEHQKHFVELYDANRRPQYQRSCHKLIQLLETGKIVEAEAQLRVIQEKVRKEENLSFVLHLEGQRFWKIFKRESNRGKDALFYIFDSLITRGSMKELLPIINAHLNKYPKRDIARKHIENLKKEMEKFNDPYYNRVTVKRIS